MSGWGVYEDATGVLWSVTPATKERAKIEAGLVGEGHRVVKVKVGRQLEAAFKAGQAQAWEQGMADAKLQALGIRPLVRNPYLDT